MGLPTKISSSPISSINLLYQVPQIYTQLIFTKLKFLSYKKSSVYTYASPHMFIKSFVNDTFNLHTHCTLAHNITTTYIFSLENYSSHYHTILKIITINIFINIIVSIKCHIIIRQLATNITYIVVYFFKRLKFKLK